MANLERKNGKWFRQIRSIIVAVLCIILVLTGNFLWAVGIWLLDSILCNQDKIVDLLEGEYGV